jgi:hypothetical protein
MPDVRHHVLLLAVIAAVSVRPTAQDCPKPPSVFACTLHGPDKAVDAHLDGSLRVTANRIEFEAFPPVENLTWSCNKVSSVEVKRRSKNAVALRSSESNYLFDLKTRDQASRFVEAAKCVCSIQR